MKQLNLDQRKALSEFCTNFAVAWLATGIIGPMLTRQFFNDIKYALPISLVWGIISLYSAVYLLKDKK